MPLPPRVKPLDGFAGWLRVLVPWWLGKPQYWLVPLEHHSEFLEDNIRLYGRAVSGRSWARLGGPMATRHRSDFRFLAMPAHILIK